jgi:hypothetical protein
MSERTRVPSEYTDFLNQRDVDNARRKAREEQEAEKLDGERWERYKAKVRREEEQRVQQLRDDAAIIKAMSQEQKAQHYAKRASDLAKDAEHLSRAAPRFPTRYTIALDECRREDAQAANRERERREAKADVPRLEADSAERVRKIAATAAAELRELEERAQAVRARRRRKEAEEEERLRAKLAAVREQLKVPA